MDPTARNALSLAALLILPLLQAYCPRLAPDVISGKVIPCRYLCIKINFFEMPSIVLSTERDGVLCSTLLLRRRGVCKNGGCVPFETDEFKGAFGKAVAAVDTFASGTFMKTAPQPGVLSGPAVDTSGSPYSTSSNTGAGPVVPVGSAATSLPVAGDKAGVSAPSTGLPLPRKTELPSIPSEAGSNFPKPMLNGERAGVTPGATAVNFGGGSPTVPLLPGARAKSETLASPTPAGSLPKEGPTGGPGPIFPIGGASSGQGSTSLSSSLPGTGSVGGSTEGSAGAASGGVSGAEGGTSRGPVTNTETTLASIYGTSP
nr:translation initiation factor IF-2-like isoform X2 [Dermacentor andersoni]